MRPFSAKIICGDCGAYYGSKVWHSTDKYRRVVWRCNGKYRGEKKCETPHLYEEDIKTLFRRAVSKLLADRSTLIADCEAMVSVLKDTSEFDAGIEKLEAEMDEISILIEKLIGKNASVAISQEDYNRKYDAYTERFEKAKAKYDKLKAKKVSRAFEADVLECFITEIKTLPELPIVFSEDLWYGIIDHVTVYEDERLVFTFKNGAEIEELL